MSGNAIKLPFADSLPKTVRNRIGDAMQILGKALPASVVSVNGSIVTVKFEIVASAGFTLPQVTVPLAGSEYVRLPIQSGCKGAVIPADAYLGGMSGLGGGVADLTQCGNLSNVIFLPIGNTGFTVVDGNVLTLYGPQGVTIRDAMAGAVIMVTTNSISLMVDGMGILINSSGTTIDGKNFLGHSHTGVQSGSSDTGPVT